MGLALALATLLLYLPVAWHGFINYDDPDYITRNLQVQRGITVDGVQWAFTTFYASNWHPIAWLSHMLDCDLFGLDPGPHHLVNVLLHTVNAVLLLALAYRLTRRLWGAAAVAALFAWHPLHVQSVAWAAERKDVLSTTLWLAALLAYEAYTRSNSLASPPDKGDRTRHTGSQRWIWYGLTLLLFAMGLMTKPMLVTFPFTLLLLDFWPLERLQLPWGGKGVSAKAGVPLPRLMLEKWPFFLLSAAACVVTFQAQRAEAVIALERHPLSERVGNALCSYGHYLLKTVWPMDLSVIYPLPDRVAWGWVVVSAAFLVAVSAYAWLTRESRPHVLSGWLWYLGTLVPVIGLVQVGGQAMADRYTYVPLIGFFWAMAVEIGAWSERHPRAGRYVTICAGLSLVVCLGLTSRELRYWRNSETLFQRALAVTRDNAVAHSNLGAAYEEDGRRTEALAEYQEALRLNPGLSQAHNNAASLLENLGRFDEALLHYQEAVKLKPMAWQAQANLAACLARQGRVAEAMQHYDTAKHLLPRDPRPAYAMAKALLLANQTEQAVQRFHEALNADPNHVQSLVYLSRVLASDPNPQFRNGREAVRLAEQAMALSPGNQPFLMDTLAMSYAEVGRFPDAIALLMKAEEQSRAAGDTNGITEIESRLRLYQSSQPYRSAPGKVGDRAP